MMALFVGLDTGLTSTKAVVYDDAGTVVASASAPTPGTELTARRVERDPRQHWKTAAATLARAVSAARDRPAHHGGAPIAGVGITGHGDGVCFVGDDLAPLAPAVLSPDSRAADVLRRWQDAGVLEAAVRAGGSVPFAGSAAPLLAWFGTVDPSLVRRSRWLLTAKDWLRTCLTGTVCTDPTDASSSFTDLETSSYSAVLGELYGLPDALRALPPIADPAGVVGHVTPSAAEETGLPTGTPVVAGLHDVASCQLATAGFRLEHVVIVAGTFGVNVVLTDRPIRSVTVTCRPAAQPGRWTVRRMTPASGANVEWALGTFGGATGPPAQRTDVGAAVEEILSDSSAPPEPVYLPYLFGGAPGRPQSAALVGLRGWHAPADLLRAVLRGVTFSHRADVDELRRVVATDAVHLTGGATRSPRWAQLFADVLDTDVTVHQGESGTLGAAMCAAVGAGRFPDLAAASVGMRAQGTVVAPRPECREGVARDYEVWRHAVGALAATPAAELPPMPAAELPAMPATAPVSRRSG
jgi:L-xylulokinase